MSTSLLDIRSDRALTLESGCKLAFVKKDGKIIPVLVLVGINYQGIDGDRVSSVAAHGKVGIIVSEQDPETHHLITKFRSDPISIVPKNTETTQLQENDWLDLNYETDKIVYPRIFINSLRVKTDSDSLIVQYQTYNEEQSNNKLTNYQVLKPYEDYSILTRSLQQQYVLTLTPDLVINKGVLGSFTGNIQTRNAIINYSISNADTSIYLDAIEILKQNSVPKVSYEVKPNIYNSKHCENLYNKLGNIIRVNDNDLKFHNVKGYISGITLDLDSPDQDTIEVKNYKTKFEDLFSTITAQTEEMKKNNTLFDAVSNAFTSTGDLSEQVLQSSIMKVDLNYAFNNGRLTIDQHNGIWGLSDSGVVAFRGGGIFTATEQNSEGNWKWNTGITPEGINANLITTGQLDTNLIKIYSGDNLRFQMNGDGIFAYKNIIIDKMPDPQQEGNQIHPGGVNIDAANSVDGKQYVVFNDDGLALVAKKGAQVLNSAKTGYYTVLSDEEVQNNTDKDLLGLQEIRRVEVSWDGFILRNWFNQPVFWAEPETGNLILRGRIEATSGYIGTWNFDSNRLWAESEVISTEEGGSSYHTYVALNSGGNKQENINNETVDTTPYAFWAGNANPVKAAFSIKKDGYLKATSGRIGGWTIQSDRLSSNVISLSSSALDTSGSNTEYNEAQEKWTSVGTKQWQAALWVHGVDSYNNMTTNTNHSLLSISSEGQLFAKQLYFIDHSVNGAIISTTSVRSLITTAQTKANNAYTYAVNINTNLDKWSLSYDKTTKQISLKKYYQDGSYETTSATIE